VSEVNRFSLCSTTTTLKAAPTTDLILVFSINKNDLQMKKTEQTSQRRNLFSKVNNIRRSK
jgi:hypothetical protein